MKYSMLSGNQKSYYDNAYSSFMVTLDEHNKAAAQELANRYAGCLPSYDLLNRMESLVNTRRTMIRAIHKYAMEIACNN